MNKKSIVSLLAAAVAAVAFGATGCGGENADKHTHAYGDWYIVTQPTQTSGGEIARDCTANDDIDTKTIPALTDTDFWATSESGNNIIYSNAEYNLSWSVKKKSGPSVSVSGKRYEYTEKTVINRDNYKIYGRLFMPANYSEGSKVPIMICGHGFGGNVNNCQYYVPLTESGIAVYLIEFVGGQTGTDKNGLPLTYHSPITEVEDMEDVIDDVKKWDFVDTGKITLLGESQGGLVAALTAARRNTEVNGLVLLYPAFVAEENCDRWEKPEDVPDTFVIGNNTVGKQYVLDMWDLDTYAEIVKYTKKVLLMHGTNDGTVDISYSDRASEAYPDCEYHVYQGAPHGPWGMMGGNPDMNDVRAKIVAYLQGLKILA